MCSHVQFFKNIVLCGLENILLKSERMRDGTPNLRTFSSELVSANSCHVCICVLPRHSPLLLRGAAPLVLSFVRTLQRSRTKIVKTRCLVPTGTKNARLPYRRTKPHFFRTFYHASVVNRLPQATLSVKDFTHDKC